MRIENELEFTQWEASSRDTIDVKRVYIDMCGDLVVGVWLSQFLFYFLPFKGDDGVFRRHSKLVYKDGHWWLPMPVLDWWEACRVRKKQYYNCITAVGVKVDRNGNLLPKGDSRQFVIHRNDFHKNKKTPYLRPNWSAFLEAFNDATGRYEVGQSADPNTDEEPDEEGAEPETEVPENSGADAQGSPAPRSIATPNNGGIDDCSDLGQSVGHPTQNKRIVPNSDNQSSPNGTIGNPQNGQSVVPDWVNNSTDSVTDLSKINPQQQTEAPIGAPAAAVEKSNDFLSSESTNTQKQKTQGVNNQTFPTSSAGAAVEITAPPLPGVSAAAVVDETPEEILDLARRFIAYADELGREISPAQALRIVTKPSDPAWLNSPLGEFAAAKKSRLATLLQREYSKLGLNSAVGNPTRSQMLEDVGRLRWRVWSWPGHKGTYEGSGYPAVKCFCARWKEDANPSDDWLKALLDADAKGQSALRFAEQKRAADEFIAGLNDAQKRNLNFKLKASPIRSSDGWRMLYPGNKEYDEAFVRFINNPKTQEEILTGGSISAEGAASAAPKAFEEAPSEAGYEPHRNVVKNCLEVHLPKIFRRLKSGDIQESDVAAECRKIVSLTSQDARWLEEQVLNVWAEEKVA